MIAPRYIEQSDSDPGGGVRRESAIVINLHIPQNLTDALMQLVATLAGRERSPSCYTDFSDSQTTTVDMTTVDMTAPPLSPARSRQVSTQEEAQGTAASEDAQSAPRPPCAAEQMGGCETLLEIFNAGLGARLAGTVTEKQRKKYITACNFWDAWRKKRLRSVRPEALCTNITESDIQEYCLWRFGSVNRQGRVPSVGTVQPEVERILGLLDSKLKPPSESKCTRWRNSVLTGSEAAKCSKIVSESQVFELMRAIRSPGAAGLFHFLSGYFGGVVSGLEVVDFLVGIHLDCGIRTQDFFAYIWSEHPKPGLLWEDVHFESTCPDADCRNVLGSDSDHPHGYLHYTVNKDVLSDESNRRVLYPMSRWQRDFLLRMKSVPRPSCRNQERKKQIDNMVFPIAFCRPQFSRDWQQLLKLADLPENIRLSEGSGKVAAIRKTAMNRWAQLTGREDVAQYMAHHADITTMAKHYLSRKAFFLPVIKEYQSQLRYDGMTPGLLDPI